MAATGTVSSVLDSLVRRHTCARRPVWTHTSHERGIVWNQNTTIKRISETSTYPEMKQLRRNGYCAPGHKLNEPVEGA